MRSWALLSLMLLGAPARADTARDTQAARDTAAAWVKALVAKDATTAAALATTPFYAGIVRQPKKPGKSCEDGVEATTRSELSAVLTCVLPRYGRRYARELAGPRADRFTVSTPAELFADPSWGDRATYLARYAGDLMVSYTFVHGPGTEIITVVVRPTKEGVRVAGFFEGYLGDI